MIERASSIGEEELALADHRNSIGDPVAGGEHPRLGQYAVGSRVVRLARPKQEGQEGQKPQVFAEHDRDRRPIVARYHSVLRRLHIVAKCSDCAFTTALQPRRSFGSHLLPPAANAG